MALLHFLKDEGFSKVVVCHLNHGLRGKESTGDTRFVKQVAGKMGYEVEVGKVDLRKMMEATGDSLELAGRNARHGFFAQCAKKHRCGSLLLGHHADDQAETVLWNLMRGSATCRGMDKTRKLLMGGRMMVVERPLLGVRKLALAGWMKSHGHKWREDASNAVSDVARNRLRNEVFPLLNDVAGRDVSPIFSRSAIAGDEWQEMSSWALAKANVLDPQGRIHLKAFRETPVLLQRSAMFEFLKSHKVRGVSASLVERSLELLDADGPATVNLPGGSRLRRRQGRIFIEPAKA